MAQITVICHCADTLLDRGLGTISKHREFESSDGAPSRCVDSRTNVLQGLARASVLQNRISRKRHVGCFFIIPEIAYFAVQQDEVVLYARSVNDIPNTGTLRAHNAPFILSSSVPGLRAS